MFTFAPSPDKPRMADHVPPHTFARMTASQQAHCCQKFIDEVVAMRKAGRDPGMSATAWCRAGLISEGVIVLDRDGNASAEISAKTSNMIEKLAI